ncbi:Flp pilus assembly protein CpaB [Maritimibacter sp. DP1N21-5]|uniref:Flp pilus assembly protein CpaB n=1 Tax=Maritimibacter sp. DP1N21-5 TaxID=2836867 RepID=UPI001C456555|nr:Flp pilus assembly protein CpaB [Maritimibacter sp. DP1N21-5]MBV7409248.1 Flp pilus assembly protein CpaB [Maritimibacter sp. DP1N21-5]
MRAVFGLVLIVGIGLAGFAVYMAKDYIGNYQAALAAERANRGPEIELTDVYVVNNTLAYGERVTDENIRIVQFPTASLPAGVFSNIDQVFPQGEKRFRTVLRSMDANEVLMETKVTGAGEDAGVSARLASGMRAFAINVDVASGVSGFLRPGDRVDIYWTGRSVNDSVTTQDVTKLIQTNVRIIAIDQTADQDRATPTVARTVTVEAAPEVVATLAQAQATGRMALALVGTLDETVVEAVEVDQNSLLGIEETKVEAPVAEEKCTIRTRKGNEIVEVQIPCPS